MLCKNIKMKKIICLFVVTVCTTIVMAQSKKVNISFKNDYEDVFHLALVIYTPDGKGITRVSNVEPKAIKEYRFDEGTEIYIADWRQEAFAMKGNDIKKSNAKPYIVLKQADNNKEILLSTTANKL
jgi:hypothetical protein